jgi:hypothetical protein
MIAGFFGTAFFAGVFCFLVRFMTAPPFLPGP